MAELRLDVQLVKQARQEAGLSQRALGRAVGRSAAFVYGLEKGRGQNGYDTVLLGRLAGALGKDVRSLILTQPAPDQTSDAAPTVGDDTAVLTAALLTADRTLSRTEVAKGLGWDLDRTHEAFTALEQNLLGTGMRLRTVGGQLRWALRPADDLLSQRQQDGLARVVHAVSGLKLDEARLLRRIATSRLPTSWDQHASNNDRVTMATLRKRGLVSASGGYYTLTPAVAYSLGLASRTVGPGGRRKRQATVMPNAPRPPASTAGLIGNQRPAGP
ncbi:MAG: hypothetical protein QOH12_3020 [Solirubrobacteraceae bacterium]|nr:hypothetical protein [Solirubrobacteraceae bacterium]